MDRKGFAFSIVPGPVAGTLTLAVLLLAATGVRFRSSLMLPDNFNYIAYWEQIVEWTFRSTPLQTPKPLLVLLWGLLYRATAGLDFLVVLFVASGALAIAAAASIARQVSGRSGAIAAVVALALSGGFLSGVLLGSSELLSTAVLLWLIARHAGADQLRLPDWKTGLALFALNLVRTENWEVAVVVFVMTIAISGVAGRSGDAASTSPLAGGYPIACAAFPMLAPLLWLAFDYLAFGNAFFSFTSARHFAEVSRATDGIATGGSWWHYPIDALLAIRRQSSAILLGFALVGVVVAAKRNRRLLILLAVLFGAPIVFWWVANRQGFVLLDRFFLGSAIVTLILVGIGWGAVYDGVWPSFQGWRRRSGHGGWLVAAEVVVVIGMVGCLLAPLRGLTATFAYFDQLEGSRSAALAAARLIRGDPDYSPRTPVVIWVVNQTLAGWALGSDGGNLTDPRSWLAAGAQFAPTVQTVYFVQDRQLEGDPGGVYSRLQANDLRDFNSRLVLDDRRVRVYKSTRIDIGASRR